MRRKIDTHTFLRGLETSGLEDGLELPAWSKFQNIRLGAGAASRRNGMVRVASAAYAHTALDFDGTNDYAWAPLDADTQTPGRHWAVECLIEPDSITGTQMLVSWDHASDYPFKLWLNAAQPTLTYQQSDGTVASVGAGTVAIGTKHAIMAVRRPSVSYDKAADDIQLWVDGSLVNTVTNVTFALKAPAGGPLFAVDNGYKDFFDGTMDYARYLSTWREDQEFSFMRLPSPKAAYVVYDYPMEQANATTLRMNDRSRHRNHATLVHAPASVTGLCVQTTPVSLLSQRIDNKSRPRLDVVIGDRIYLVEEPLR